MIAKGREAFADILCENEPVTPRIFAALSSQRIQIQTRWEALLRADRAANPLAEPEALVPLIAWAVGEVFVVLRESAHLCAYEWEEPMAAERCCGYNPHRVFFQAGTQAMLEGLVLAQAQIPDLETAERDQSLRILRRIYHQIAQREIEAFCAICQHRPCLPAEEALSVNSGDIASEERLQRDR